MTPLTVLIERAIFGEYGPEAERLARALRDIAPAPKVTQDMRAEMDALIKENADLRERLERTRGRAHDYAQRRLDPVLAENAALRSELGRR